MIKKIVYPMFVAAILGLLATGCKEEEGIIEITIHDVSSRITGMPDFTGTGAEMEINGTQLQNIERIIFGDVVVRRIEMTVTETSIKFNTPAIAPLGENKIVLVFPGGDRAFTSVDVIPRQTILWFDPLYGSEDDVITVHGTNLDIVSSAKIGEAEGTILEKSKTLIKFSIPSGAVTDYIYLESDAGIATSEGLFIACPDDVYYECLPDLLGADTLPRNGNFEDTAVVVGLIGSDLPGSAGSQWWLAGSGTRVQYEIIASPGNYPGLGTKLLKATVLAMGEAEWSDQIVNEGYVCDSNRCFLYTGKVWSDISGRQIRVTGGVHLPGYSDMRGDTTLNLKKGWNEWATRIWHAPEQRWTVMRLQVNFGFPINEGAVLMFDDFRVVDVGPRSDSTAVFR
ncbi:MAG: hypothetical protein JW973_18120 [Bacteroidales bacterium]|nr:hypothetical protein [Bacteroidales bacterium]